MNLDFAFRISSIFGTLDVRQRSRLQSLVTIRRFDAGTTILRQGTSAVALYLILDGQVEVTREPAEGGPPVSLATLKTGDVFGEMSLLDDDTRSSSVTALEVTHCALLPRWELIQELKRQPDLAMELLRTLARRIRTLDERLSVLTGREGQSASSLS
jgi:CRP/FNR family transcriptional regulator